VKIANDGKIYVCDRGNDRIQVFDKNDPTLGKPCSNPTGEAGKCGFVAEQFVSDHTNIIGTAVSMNFSTDKAQSCLYVGDNANMTIYILNRSNLQELGQFGRSGRRISAWRIPLPASGERGQQGQHLYRPRKSIPAKRIQKFLRYGAIAPLKRVQRNRIVSVSGCVGGVPTRTVISGAVSVNNCARSTNSSSAAIGCSPRR
jgi:hypothetical protein